MQVQKSFNNEEHKGILYLVPTPIGNLEDMSYRSVRILKEADLIAAEDTRNSKKLCNYFEIDTHIVSYHEHNRESSGYKIIEKLKEGRKVALISDAGMPAISDPGYELVVTAIEEEITVVPVPGANAGLTALIASGLATQPFYFYGFLDRQKKDKKRELEMLANQTSTIILYESPHRLKKTLQLIYDVLGNRRAALCRELTKKYEEFIRGNIEELIHWGETQEIKGEFCIILEGASEEVKNQTEWWEHLSINEHVDHYISVKNVDQKDAIKQTAKDRGLNKREVYHTYHIQE